MTGPVAGRHLEIAARYAEVRGRCDEAARRSGRSPDEITLVAVTKTFPAEDVVSVLEAGATDIGENRVQEGEAKRPLTRHPAARWHLIGPLQSNKARRAVELFDVVETVDSPKLAARLDRLVAELARPPLPVLVEVHLGGEESKSGVAESGVEALVHEILALPRLVLDGMMAIPPFSDAPASIRPWVRQLAAIRDRVRSGLPADAAARFRHLSIGMSHDFAEAIEEGATIVRVGTAIFGRR